MVQNRAIFLSAYDNPYIISVIGIFVQSRYNDVWPDIDCKICVAISGHSCYTSNRKKIADEIRDQF